MMKALPGISNVMLLMSIFWLMFSILGVSLLKGVLQTCDTDIALGRDACIDAGGSWGNFNNGINISFDSECLVHA